MAWIESHQGLGQHPKTLKLARLLNISKAAAVGHLHYLWWWCVDYAEDGNLALFDPSDIATAGAWEDDPNVFKIALIDAGFLDENLTIHDWMEYAGRLVQARKRKADGMKRQRAVTLPERAVTNRTQPNRTQPYPTIESTAPSTTCPDWYTTLSQINGFTFSLEHCQAWLDSKNIGVDRADEVAFSVKSKWPGPKSRPYTDPWATFQSWVKRPPLPGVNSHGKSSNNIPGNQSESGSEDRRARDLQRLSDDTGRCLPAGVWPPEFWPGKLTGTPMPEVPG